AGAIRYERATHAVDVALDGKLRIHPVATLHVVRVANVEPIFFGTVESLVRDAVPIHFRSFERAPLASRIVRTGIGRVVRIHGAAGTGLFRAVAGRASRTFCLARASASRDRRATSDRSTNLPHR